MYVCMHVCVYVCIYLFMYDLIYLYLNKWRSVRVLVRLGLDLMYYGCMHVCMYRSRSIS